MKKKDKVLFNYEDLETLKDFISIIILEETKAKAVRDMIDNYTNLIISRNKKKQLKLQEKPIKKKGGK